MAFRIKHLFTSPKSDGADPTLVQPSNWNADHDFQVDAGKLVGRDSSGGGAAQELPGAFDPDGNFALTDARGFFLPAKGSTIERPSGVSGYLRWNTTTSKMEFFDGTNWQNCATEDWVTAAIAAVSGFSTGDVKFTIKATADAGWLMFADQTIGSTSSGATYANDNCHDLFILIWQRINNAYAPVTGGRGASAAADWAANKRIKLLTTLGRFLGFAGAGAGLTNRAPGSTVGSETHTIDMSELPFRIPYADSDSVGGPVHGVGPQTPTPMPIMNPGVYLNCMVKL